MKILVVDNEPDFLRGLINEFKNRGHEVVAASCGEEALIKFGAEDFDIITLDIVMPDIDGVKVLRRMKEEKPKIAVVIVTALDYRYDDAVWISEGYIVKQNLSFEEIVSAVEAVISWQRTGEIRKNRR